ncbi:MAG: TIGR02677 family protein [Anaeromicrobium sp.]|jgi:uncharacterized protein (TIGR02677 family)|uniref:TIGR02677 family protein n=1 Tax=Anaeromicrobium sp. TaxID=1929132 RepID=UPI0025EADC97|nr:TIGR02677 family protein [Anaeromicrobium sp.]MCT4594239.1 TIGR02677 family protein [Anaeromicrobium sp.]
MDKRVFKKIMETSYLTAENAWRYRAIVRFFYKQYEKMKYWMYKEEVFEELNKYEEFKEYTIDQCKSDLESLANWKNLIPIQDTSKASTIEEFKNKQFRYKLSDYSVEIERMTIKLENLKIETASLEPTLLERIRIELEKINKIYKEDKAVVRTWWDGLNEDFKRLNNNYQDCISDLYGIKAEEMMKTQEFLLFKDRFIEYLRNFIKGLQHESLAIEAILKELDKEKEVKVFNKVLEYEKSIPRLDMDFNIKDLEENIWGSWNNIKNWFLGSNNRESEAEKLFDITNEIIRKITRYAYQIVEMKNSRANRKEEYRKLCELFLECEDIREAHKLSALSFGIFNMKHLRRDMIRETESINSGVYEEKAHEVIIKPRVRTYREKMDKTPMIDNSEKKEKMLLDIIKKREEEESVMKKYIEDNSIYFSKLPIIQGHVRATLLKWLSKGINSPNKRSKTEDGRSFRVYRETKEKVCVLNCEDGNFQMPAYVIEFETGE